MGVTPTAAIPRDERPAADSTHSAIAVNLDACINCGLCVRACREVQMNDVIGMAYRGHGAKVVFDFDEGMGDSTCVACGECVQVCPTGALMEKSLLDDAGKRVNYESKSVDTLCPYCGVGCQTKVHVKDDKILYVDGRDGPANNNRLCVKGRFGFDYIHHPDRLTKPLIRRDGVAKDANMQIRREEIGQVLPRGDLGGGAEQGRRRPEGDPHARRRQGDRRLRLGQGLQRGGLSVPEADPAGLRHQQRRSLHAAVPRLLGGRTDGRLELGRRDGAVHGRQGRRLHHRHRRAAGREPSGRRDLPQERGGARRQADRDGPARPEPGHRPLRQPHAAVQAGPRRGAAQRHAQRHRRGGHGRHPVRAGPHRGLRGPEGQGGGLHAGGDGARVRHPRGHHPRGGASLRPLRALAHLLGHGHLPAHARHRQRALPDRAGARHRPDRPARHRPASAARPEQRAGRLRRRPDPDGVPRLQVGGGPGHPRHVRGVLGHRSCRPSAA